MSQHSLFKQFFPFLSKIGGAANEERAGTAACFSEQFSKDFSILAELLSFNYSICIRSS